MILFHGTSAKCWEKVRINGLKSRLNMLNEQLTEGCYLTDNQQSALDYAINKAQLDDSQPVVLRVLLEDFQLQPNGSVAPPFFTDSYHNDTMPGKAWYYDKAISPEQIWLAAEF